VSFEVLGLAHRYRGAAAHYALMVIDLDTWDQVTDPATYKDSARDHASSAPGAETEGNG
jgi:hypothetical protein